MKTALKILLIAVGLYLVWRYLSARGAGAEAAPGQLPPPSPTCELVAAAAAQAGYPAGTLLNTDEWNYFYTQVRGAAAPAPEDVWPGRERNYRMTLDEWWAGVSQHGLSGLATVRPRDPAAEAWGIQ